MAESGSAVLSIEDAWNSVALEERIELIARSQAFGLACAMACLLAIGSMAYGLDQPLLLFGAVLGAITIGPVFSSRHWRKNKPATIMEYLAVRSIARRYAVGFNIREVDIVLIFKGTIKELLSQQELEQIAETQAFSQEIPSDAKIPVWICLFRGGVVVLSEHIGGAKLECVSVFGPDMSYRDPGPADGASDNAIVLGGIGDGRSRTLLLDSKYRAALYVFKRRALKLNDEVVKFREHLQRMAHDRAEAKAKKQVF
jgi:hypothetical protein